MEGAAFYGCKNILHHWSQMGSIRLASFFHPVVPTRRDSVSADDGQKYFFQLFTRYSKTSRIYHCGERTIIRSFVNFPGKHPARWLARTYIIKVFFRIFGRENIVQHDTKKMDPSLLLLFRLRT